MDGSPSGASVHGISQARMLEWVAMLSSRGSSKPRDQTHVSCMVDGFFITPTSWEAQSFFGEGSFKLRDEPGTW